MPRSIIRPSELFFAGLTRAARVGNAIFIRPLFVFCSIVLLSLLVGRKLFKAVFRVRLTREMRVVRT